MSFTTIDARHNSSKVYTVIRDITEEMVHQAVELAQRINLSAVEILEESKLLMASVGSRLKSCHNVSPWDISMSEGKYTFDATFIKPVAATGHLGRPAWNAHCWLPIG